MATCLHQHLQKDFDACGIFPFSPEKVVKKTPAARSSNAASSIKETRVGEAVLSHLKKQRYKSPASKNAPPKRNRINVSPGRSISFEELSSKKLTKQKRKHCSTVKKLQKLKKKRRCGPLYSNIETETSESDTTIPYTVTWIKLF